MEPWKPTFLKKDGSFSRPVARYERLDWLDWLLEDPKLWQRRRRFKPLGPHAPDPKWMIRARAEAERRDSTPIKIRPAAWQSHRLAPYAWYVVHLAQAVNRELSTQVPAREVRVLHSSRKRDDWILRIEIDFDLPRPFTIEGLVDPGDFRTAPFFREIGVNFISKAFLPGELNEKNGELVSGEDFCIVLNEWRAPGGRGAGGREPGAGEVREANGAGGQEPGAGEGSSLLDLLHKFVPPPRWWRGYFSPFKLPYSLWYSAGPLPEWAERRLFHRTSTDWPWLPDGEARERMKVWAQRKWKNRKRYWKDGVERRVTRPSVTDVRNERGVWQKPYSRSAKKLHRKKSAWRPEVRAPGNARQMAAFCAAGPFELTTTEAKPTNSDVANPPGPWPKWKVRREMKAKPKKCSRRAVEINQVWFRYLRAVPTLQIAPLKARARRYRVQARLIPMGRNLYLAELFEFDAELQRALKHYSRKFCEMPKSKRVAMRDRVRKPGQKPEQIAPQRSRRAQRK